MKKSSLSFWLGSVCALTLATPLLSQQECDNSSLPMRVDVRYTTPDGIGYNSGYTTLEGFFSAPYFFYDSWIPFVDVRGHIFNNGKWAANGGLGVRYLRCSRVWGLNAYYDYRDTHRQRYNQVAAGFECLGDVWDFRINGYLPVGKKTSPYSTVQFGGFKGNSLFIKYNREFALKGANAEAGYHLDRFRKAQFYFAAGPYYLTGVGKTTWGGEARAVMELCHRYLRLEGNTSYDHFFKWVGQGQVSLNIPFGIKGKERNEERCSPPMPLCSRARQRIDRNEIIPVGKQKFVQPAIDPATGSPWVFWFVNNTSSSAGTYESPFPTLLAAQKAASPNQAIYVFPGDGTTTGMNAGITLQNGQQLLGASVTHSIPTTRGSVTLPPLATLLPLITNTTGNVVTLANNNTVSGLYIMSVVNYSSGVAGTGISNLTVDQSTFVCSDPNTLSTNGIYVVNPSGSILVTNSTFREIQNNDISFNGNGIYLQLLAGYNLANLNVTGCTFDSIGSVFNPTSNPPAPIGYGGNGILANILGGSIDNYTVTNCSFTKFLSGSNLGSTIAANFAGGTINTLSVLGNTFDFINFHLAPAIGVFGTGTLANLVSLGNTFNNFGPLNVFATAGLGIYNQANITTVTSSKDTFTNFTGSTAFGNGGTITTFNILGDTFSNFDLSVILQNGGTITTLNSTGNTYSLIDGYCLQNQASATITTFNSSFDTFNTLLGNTSAIQNEAGGAIINLNVTNDTFSNISNSASGINYNLSVPASVALNLSNNTFTGVSPIPGFATTINVSSGNLCLNFTGNKAAPTNSPAPYLFTQTNGGSFNYSNVSGNTGIISTSGTVPTGTCSLP